MSIKYILITGSSRGLGETLAKYFARSGFNLCLVARNKNILEELSTKLSSETSQHIIPIACDLTDSQDIENLISVVKSDLPSLDVLINNAAILINSSISLLTFCLLKNIFLIQI